jgi:hypothetical protein
MPPRIAGGSWAEKGSTWDIVDEGTDGRIGRCFETRVEGIGAKSSRFGGRWGGHLMVLAEPKG